MPPSVDVRPWSDLSNSPGWPSLLELIQARQEDIVNELRGAVRAGNTNLAARKEGGLEELERLLLSFRRYIEAELQPKPDVRSRQTNDPFAVPVR